MFPWCDKISLKSSLWFSLSMYLIMFHNVTSEFITVSHRQGISVGCRLPLPHQVCPLGVPWTQQPILRGLSGHFTKVPAEKSSKKQTLQTTFLFQIFFFMCKCFFYSYHYPHIFKRILVHVIYIYSNKYKDL